MTGMKKTDYKVCVGTSGKYGYPVYRSVVTDGTDYYVKWQGKMVNVNKEIEKRQYIRKSWGD